MQFSCSAWGVESVKPKKHLGQHFLKNRSFAQKIVESLLIREGDMVLEIGPGTGVLTELLVESKAGGITLVEVDTSLAERLQKQFVHDTRVRVICGDILKLNWEEIRDRRKIKVIGNLPYYITSPILFRLLEKRDTIDSIVVTVQKEVGERLESLPGRKTYGIPSVLFQTFGTVEKLFTIPNHAFIPKPEVSSAVVRLTFFDLPPYPVSDERFFRHLVKTAFGQRRKMLKNTVKTLLDHPEDMNRINIDLSRRPESLSVEEWVQLGSEIMTYRDKLIVRKNKEK